MADTVDKKESDFESLTRCVVRNTIRRSVIVSKIRYVHALAQRAVNDLSAAQELVMAAKNLDTLWLQFEAEDIAVLDSLIATSSESEYSTDFPAEVLLLVIAAKAIGCQYDIGTQRNNQSGDRSERLVNAELDPGSQPTFDSSTCCLVTFNTPVEQLVEKVWRVEKPVAASLNFTDGGKCESIFRELSTRDQSGRFIVPLPVRVPINDTMFSGSREVAVKRFGGLERGLESDKKLRVLFNEFMSEYLSLGHMSVAESPGQYFIPHHAVIKPEDGCTKIRVVFDASARCFNGLSSTNASQSWDDPLPDDIHRDWAQFMNELSTLSSIRIPRYFNAVADSPCYLFGFCDASQHGYAAVVYLRVLNTERESSVFLVGTKTKLAPIKSLTVPRLELNAALLLARWLSRLENILRAHVTIVDTFAWTDSLIVLSWLTVPHESFKQYVSNRVHQIQVLLPNCNWRHVPSSCNPADCASRGLMPSELTSHLLYWHGPDFIYDDPCDWDTDSVRLPYFELPEIHVVSLTIAAGNAPPEWLSRFSSFDRMLRVISWIRRFLSNCRHLSTGCTNVLSRAELDAALRVVVLGSQRHYFGCLHSELSSSNRVSSKPLARLCPFIDAEDVIRVGGRLRHSKLSYDNKHPILLSKMSHLSILICQHWHKITCHSGPHVMSALISRRFWIMSVRSVIYRVISRCTICVRLNAMNPQPLMADLPAARVQECRPFIHVGIDYAGPLQLREHKLRKPRTYKVYIAIFICFGVKAVHLEVVSDLSTEAFLAAFDRFVARRGLPSDVHSDCGTNFVGAAKELRNLISSPVAREKITVTAFSVINWHFNPPSAPHFGGLWEAAVRSAKRLLVRVMGPHTFTYEEFTTILCRVEAVLNSRPLTPASSDPHDLECLTPGHFLIGQPLLSIPPRVSPNIQRTLPSRWKLLDQCHQTFWRRWSTEYLHTLQTRSKWVSNQCSVQVNDMVVIRDNNIPPINWRLGRVIEILPGTDNIVRVVRILTAQGIMIRPVVKITILPTQPGVT